MRHFVIRRISTRDVIGIVAIPNYSYVGVVWREKMDDQSVCVNDISESEYTTFQAFDLFPTYHCIDHSWDRFVTVYNPEMYKVVGIRIESI